MSDAIVVRGFKVPPVTAHLQEFAKVQIAPIADDRSTRLTFGFRCGKSPGTV
jgi:hypothetical protein